MLSPLDPDETQAAIISEDVNTLKRIKGIGPKTAKRAILGPKDKMLKDSGEELALASPKDNTIRDEALNDYFR